MHTKAASQINRFGLSRSRGLGDPRRYRSMKTFGIALLSIGLLTTITLVFIAANSVLHATNHGRTGQTLLKLTQLEAATDSYEVRYGDRFPHGGRHRIQSHFQRIAPWMESPIALLETNGRTVDTLGEAETLVLFLGDDIKLVFENMEPEFEFPNDQLVDRDNDGWKEYVSLRGELYTIHQGHVVARNIDTGELIKVPDESTE